MATAVRRWGPRRAVSHPDHPHPFRFLRYFLFSLGRADGIGCDRLGRKRSLRWTRLRCERRLYDITDRTTGYHWTIGGSAIRAGTDSSPFLPPYHNPPSFLGMASRANNPSSMPETPTLIFVPSYCFNTSVAAAASCPITLANSCTRDA